MSYDNIFDVPRIRTHESEGDWSGKYLTPEDVRKIQESVREMNAAGVPAATTPAPIAPPPKVPKTIEVGNMLRTPWGVIEDAFTAEPRLNPDARGEFVEQFNDSLLDVFPNGVRQVSMSRSKRHVLRGIHFQVRPAMGKLIRVVTGQAVLVLVDLRQSSPTYKRWERRYIVSDDVLTYVPPGVGVAFVTYGEETVVQYFHSSTYNPESSYTIAWDDPTLNINWGHMDNLPILSKKDWRAMSFLEWEQHPEAKFL